ncbi:MAG: helix-turn-helix transcriptional regulator [Ferruginibacter sp.]|nr:helix-turn-helix transcriptional regulator [Ferruginibacter sp.]
MKYFTIPPSQTIAKYVRTFWVLEGTLAQDQIYTHRTMADGSAELFFHYDGIFDELLPNDKTESSIASGISGPSEKFNRFCIRKNFGMFGVYLYPFALPHFFKIPASSLSNEMPDLETLLGQAGKELEEKIMLAKDNCSRVQLMTSFFEERLAHNNCTHTHLFDAIHYIIQNKGTTKVEELATLNFLSVRQFERNFKSFAGFSPKLYSRIIRFQSAINQYGNKNRTLTQIAYDCGYYDQSHFIHDFKEFSGYHPQQYFSGNAEGVEWRDT